MNRLEKVQYKYYVWRRKKLRAKFRAIKKLEKPTLPQRRKASKWEQKYADYGMKWWLLHRTKSKFEDGQYGYDLTDTEISMQDVRDFMANHEPNSDPRSLNAEYDYKNVNGKWTWVHVGDTSTQIEMWESNLTFPDGRKRTFVVRNGALDPSVLEEPEVAQAFENWKASR